LLYTKALSIAKKKIRLSDFQTFRLSDFQSQILQSVRRPKGSDFTLSVQVGVHSGLRDYDQSLVPTSESPKSVFNFVAMDEIL